MSTVLTKGANAPIDSPHIELVLSWSGSLDVDVMGLLCASSGKVRTDDDFVFYNQPRHPSAAVQLAGKVMGAESTDTLAIDLGTVESEIEKIVVAGPTAEGDFSRLSDVAVSVVDSRTKIAALRFAVPDATVETTMILGELYRRNGKWKFRAVGQGYSSGLRGLAVDFGITVDEDPAPAPSPIDPPAAPPKPPTLAASARSRRRATRVATTPALQTADEQMRDLAGEWQRIADHVGTAADQMLRAVLYPHADLSGPLAALSSTRHELSQSYEARFGQSASAGYKSSPETPENWVHAARDVITHLRHDPVPWTQKRREAWKSTLGQQVSDLLGRFAPTERELAVSAWQQMRHVGATQANTVKQSAARSAPPLHDPPPPVGPRTMPIDPANPEPTGPGPLNFHLGRVVAEWLSFSTTSHGGHQSATDKLKLPGVRIPIVVDLDATGAMVIDDRRCIEGSLLNLLSALPANQLLLRIFDPERGGDSAKFLYGLGDSADRIIGDRVKTSDRELNDLLQSTEEHITFVTQRFLQGEHKSLTEYNHAAGEVAEPYQLIVLYDFPSGFSRSGHVDTDQLDRLSKIIRNGPRSGVFTILVCRDVSSLRVDPKVDRGRGFSEQSPREQEDHAIARLMESLPWFVSRGPVTARTMTAIASGPHGLRIPTTTPAPAARGVTAGLGDATLAWRFEPAGPPSDVIAASQLDTVKRNMHTARDVQVTPDRVAELADQAQRSATTTLGERFEPTVANPARPDTWWRATSSTGVVAHFGRIGARQVADLIIDSEVNTYSALIGGRPGSGKSVLIHAIIMSIVTEYPPSEVELFLIDFKEGVEFKQYADIGLPHARVIAIESERDFGLSVLQRTATEIKRRGELFRGKGQGAANLAQFRTRTRQSMKRLVLVIDEFQQLFYRDDKIASEAAEILELILRQGRAFGIHLLLASQSLAGMASLGKHVLGLIPTRIALQSNENDSRMILGEENVDAQSLTRAGEGILNRKGGQKDANERFQAAFWDADERGRVLQSVVDRARSEGHPAITTVFAGHVPADVTSVDSAALLPPQQKGSTGVSIPVGLPLTLDPVPLFAHLRREEGGNLLIVDERGQGALAMAVASLCRQGASVDLLDFVGEDDEWSALVAVLEGLHGVSQHGRRALGNALSELKTLVEERHSTNDRKAPARVLVIAAMGRARDLDPTDYDDASASNVLGAILRDGPEVGVHTVCWFDRAAGVNKRLDRQLGEFGRRLVAQLTRDDSATLIDSDAAAALKSGQGILADVDRATEHKIRTFAPPPPAWLDRFARTAR